jgi:hypothetical protein
MLNAVGGLISTLNSFSYSKTFLGVYLAIAIIAESWVGASIPKRENTCVRVGLANGDRIHWLHRLSQHLQHVFCGLKVHAGISDALTINKLT